MRILTVRQPWAAAIIHSGKDVENRSRNIAGKYRGPVAIHAAKGMGASFDARHPELWPFDDRHILGAIIGVVDLVGVHPSASDEHGQIRCDTQKPWPWTLACSRWADESSYHLVLANPRPLAEPIPYRGALGLRTITDEAILKQLEES